VTMLVRCLAMMRGGGETRHLAWARELQSLGVSVELVAGRPLLFRRPRYAVETDAPVTLLRSPYARDFVYRYQRRRGFGRLTMSALHADETWFCRAAWRHIAASPALPDVVHAHALHQIARLRTREVPVVINLPGEPNARYTADLRLADALVADGWAAQHLSDRIGCPVEPLTKGVDVERFRPDGPSVRQTLRLHDRQVVIAVSRLVPIKNVQLLIEAVALLRTRATNPHLLIVGDGPWRDAVRARAGQLDVAECVTFAGSVPHRETPAFYRAADVFALSSDFDNSPNAVLEAMACALPIVATDAGGVRDFVDVPAGGAIVPPGDAAALANALESYLLHPTAARAAGAYNRKRAAAQFSWRTSALQLLDVYQRIVRVAKDRESSAEGR
jgi:glycosyltransferase involved in cell wall biosynthesis